MKFVRVLSICALFACAFTSPLVAQHTRKVLMEEFTSMTCPPCAAYKPGIDAFAKTANVVTVTYHQNYPAPGDPYNTMDATLNVTRHNWYGLNSIPHVFLDGTEADLSSTAALAAAAAPDLASSSPLLITISEDRSSTPYKVTVKVKNDGTEGLSGKTLQIMVVNYYADLSKYPDVVNNANTRYSEFDYCILKAMPTINGSTITLGAGEEKTFNYNYSMGSNLNLWNSPYVVAFVQDPSTKQVIQAESDFASVARTVTIQSNDAAFQVTPRSKTIKKTFTLTNPTTGSMQASVGFASNPAVPANWTAPTLSATNVSIPAKGTATIDVNFSVAANGGSMFNTLVVSPSGSGINLPTALDFGYVAENTKYCVLTQLASDLPGDAYNQLNALSGYRNEVAYIPGQAAVFSQLNITKFNAVIVPIDFAHRTAYVTDDFAATTRSLFEGGSNLIFFGDAHLANAMDAGNPSLGWQDFLQSIGISGIKNSAPTARFNNVSPPTPKAFTIQGLAGDAIGDKMTLSMNSSASLFQYYSEDITYTPGVNSITPFLAYADASGSHAGVHLQTDNARAIILGFTPDAIASGAARSVLYNKMMSWLVAQPDIKVTATTADTLDFGDVTVGTAKTATAVIQNSGSADLVISAVDLGSGSDYTLTWVNPFTLPFTLAAGAKQNMNFSLNTSKEGAVLSNCTITSNAKSAGVDGTILNIKANAKLEMSVPDANSVDGLLSMRVLPNPVQTVANINFSINTTYAQVVSVQLFDSKGQLVRNVLENDSRATGVYNLALDVQDLAYGAYRLIMRTANSSVAAPLVIVK